MLSFKLWLEEQEQPTAGQRPYLTDLSAAPVKTVSAMRQAVPATRTKFMGGKGSLFCGLCSSEVQPHEVKENPAHHFTTGLLYQCRCGDCKFWGNSVREPNQLKSYLAGTNPSAAVGFCYDTYCGFCNGHHSLEAVRNDAVWNGKLVNVMTCRQCGKNNHLLMVSSQGRPADFIKDYERLMPGVQRGGMLFQARRKLTGLDAKVGH